MDVWQLIVAALRRWYVLVPLLLATAAFAWVARESVNPEYEARGVVQLVRPTVSMPETNDTSVVNPYLDLNDTLQALQFSMSSPQTRSDVEAQGLLPDYEVELANRTAIASVTVRGGDAEQTRQTGITVIGEMDDLLNEKQQAAGVPRDLRVTLDILDSPGGDVADVSRSQTQVAVIVLGIGSLVSFFAAILADDIWILVTRRRSRPKRRAGASSSEESEWAAEDDWPVAESEEPPRERVVSANSESARERAKDDVVGWAPSRQAPAEPMNRDGRQESDRLPRVAPDDETVQFTRIERR